MELKLTRNEKYELIYNDIVVGRADSLSEILPVAKSYAKKFQKKLFIAQAALSDWYVGFPTDKEAAPILFFSPNVTASMQSQYRFVEGPFLSKNEAKEAAFLISGKVAIDKK